MLTDFNSSEIQAVLEERLLNAPPRETRRALCLWLCNRADFTSAEIAALLGLQTRAVQRLRERLKKEGRRALYQTHGGNRKTLSREDELSLLLGFLANRKQNPTASLRQAYEQQLGRQVSHDAFSYFMYRFGIQLDEPRGLSTKSDESSVSMKIP